MAIGNAVSFAYNEPGNGSLLLSTDGTTAGTGFQTSAPLPQTGLPASGALTPCFLAGTRIATARGEVAVEALAIGAMVRAAGGGERAVKWIGRRSYAASVVAVNPQLRPVLIRAGALAAGVPRRDLRVSALHGIYLDGAIVPAAALVNGVSIVRDAGVREVAYLHVELDGHDVIYAEGAAVESFRDEASRLMFDNVEDYFARYGVTGPMGPPCAPRMEEGFALEALRRRIAERAGGIAAAGAPGALRGHVERMLGGVLEGWVVDVENPAVPVKLVVLRGGVRMAGVLANRYRVDLDHAGLAGGNCGFRLALGEGQVEVRRRSDGAVLAWQAVEAVAG